MFGCFGAFVHPSKLKLKTGSTRSWRGPVRPLELRQCTGKGDTGKSSEGEEMADVQVIELFGLTELVDNLELTLKPMVSCTKKTVIASISGVAGVAVNLLNDLGFTAAKKINAALGGVSNVLFSWCKPLHIRTTCTSDHCMHCQAVERPSACEIWTEQTLGSISTKTAREFSPAPALPRCSYLGFTVFSCSNVKGKLRSAPAPRRAQIGRIQSKGGDCLNNRRLQSAAAEGSVLHVGGFLPDTSAQ